MKQIIQEYEKENKKLFNFIKSKIHSYEDAEDVLQDVFVRAVSNFNTVESLENITSWLYSVAKNRIVDFFRKKRETTESDFLGMDLSLEELIEDSGITIEDELTEKWVMDEIEIAINLLPEKQREVYILHEINGVSFKDIEEQTGTPINTLLSRKRYAVQFLRSVLEEIYYELYEE